MECEFCLNHEQGDTLYEPSDWDGGIGFDYIRDIKYCPLCGRKLHSDLTFEKDECAKEYEELGLKELKELIEADHKTEPTISKMEQVDKDINVRSKDEPQTERSNNADHIE